MANNYTQFSERIDDVTPEEAEWIESVLGFDVLDYDDEEGVWAAMSELLNCDELHAANIEYDWWPGFEWSTRGSEKGSLWLHCEEGFQEDHFVLFVQSFIKKFRPDYVFTFSAACYCSKPSIKEFGGTWMVITKDRAVGGNTWDAAEEAVADDGGE